MRNRVRSLCAIMLIASASSAMQAQEPVPPPSAERDSLEQRVRQRMGQMMKTQLGLTDDQMRKLQTSNRRFEAQRRDLFQQERTVRSSLRAELRAGDTARQAEVEALLDRMMLVQRQRTELIEAEQNELATFMTPIQRARYFGMEEQIRRRVMEMRDGDRRGPPGPGSRRPPAATRRPRG